MRIILSIDRGYELRKVCPNTYAYWNFSSLPFSKEHLSQEELELLGESENYYFSFCGVFTISTEKEKNLEKPKDFLDGADELKRIIFSLIDEINLKKISRNKRHKGIEGVVDYLQERDNKHASAFLAFYKVLQAIETIRSLKKEIKTLPSHYTDDFVLGYNSEIQGLILETQNTHPQGRERVKTPVALKDVSLDILLGVLVDTIDLPRTVSI